MKKLVLFWAVAVIVAASPAFAQSKALVAAAQKEGQLTVIALPHDWVNYGEAIETFTKKYNITINELNPDGGSGTKSKPSRPIKTTRARRLPT